MSLAFVVNPLDRRANDRNEPAWLAAQLASPSAVLLQLAGDAALLEEGALVTRWEPIESLDASGTIFLGLDAQGAPWFAREVPRTAGDLRDLRSLAMAEALPPEQLGILAQARAILSWHSRHKFCSACGELSAPASAGYRRHCAACDTDHFPRTDPVVIIAVRHQGRVLLGRQPAFRPGMYSCLAGFLEPGETLEDAARREVMEEAGIRVGPIHYVSSQPWPFPGSLMIGLIGDALTSEIRIDDKELEDARWFEPAELQQMIDRTHPEGLFAANPMAIAHHLVRIALAGSPI